MSDFGSVENTSTTSLKTQDIIITVGLLSIRVQHTLTWRDISPLALPFLGAALLDQVDVEKLGRWYHNVSGKDRRKVVEMSQSSKQARKERYQRL